MKKLRKKKSKIKEEYMVKTKLPKAVYGTFKIRKKKSLPSFISADMKDDFFRWCLNRDFTWVLISAVGQ